MLIGYARISTDDQNLALQRDALAAAGCEKVYEDRISGARAERPGLALALEVARAGDTLVVWRLDRLGRYLGDLIALSKTLERRGVGLKSLKEQIDTTSSGGRLVFHMFAALAEFERDLIRERTRAGLAAARARGRKGGRPPVMTPEKAAVARQLYDARRHPVAAIAKTLGVSRASVYRALEAPPAGASAPPARPRARAESRRRQRGSALR